MRRWWRPWAVVAAVVLIAAQSAPAWADGDPASDVLLSQAAFVPPDAGFSALQQDRLAGLLRVAAGAGHPVRVAIIPDAYDLGSITVLWRRPETYARFLGAELALVYKHPLVVVMPDGLGLNWPGHSTAQAQRQLAGLTVGSGSAGLLDAVVTAVRRLLSADHVPLSGAAGGRVAAGTASRSAGGAAASGSGTGMSLWLIVGASLAGLVAAGVLAVRLAPTRRRWLVPVGIGAIALATGGGVLAGAQVRGKAAGPGRPVAATGTQYMRPYTLPEGRQRAPFFVLRDQNGHRLSLASFRGRDVLITFVDPLCRNLCPLEAHVLNALVDQLPSAQRPAIIAVSVDVYADTRHDLSQDFRRWSLVPQWHWAVGSHAQLASVWSRYAISVQVVTKTLAGTTVHYITHTEASYLIDPAGYERALFAWPFSPQQVLTTLRRSG